ncbi:MAG: DUF1028 domain-containing protein [Acidihalobacter sp.]
MTFSLIARDPATGDLGAAVATGGPCVGGYVLHLQPGVGAIATQGYRTNMLYGPGGLRLLEGGADARETVDEVIGRDRGRDYRQLIVLDRGGGTAGWTGAFNTDEKLHLCEPDLALAGNLLHSTELLYAMREAFLASRGPLVERLLKALTVSRELGGDSRGEWSAAARVVSMDRAPLDLRVDFDADPVARLFEVYEHVQAADFQTFLRGIPVPSAPDRY